MRTRGEWSLGRPIAVAVALAASCGIGRAAIDGDAELLRLVANGHRANLEAIRTWRGRAEVATRRYAEGSKEATHRTGGSAEFVWNAETGAYRMRWKAATDPSSTLPPADVPLLQGTLAGYDRTLVLVGDVAYEKSLPLAGGEENGVGRQFAQISDTATFHRGGRIVEFSARDYLAAEGEDVHSRMTFYYEHAGDHRMEGSIKREGDVVVFERRLGVRSTVYRFDLSRGCNLIEYRQKRPTYESTWTYAYEEVSGVFVPSEVAWQRSDYGRERVERTIAFADNEVNEDVDESEFSLAALGLNAGDIIVDERTGTRYTYEPVIPQPGGGEAADDTDLPFAAP